MRGYDVLAWALYRNKRFDEAKTAIGEAMKLGTRDPDFFYHAGMIYDALGDRAAAAKYLEEAARTLRFTQLTPALVPGRFVPPPDTARCPRRQAIPISTVLASS